MYGKSDSTMTILYSLCFYLEYLRLKLVMHTLASLVFTQLYIAIVKWMEYPSPPTLNKQMPNSVF